MPVAILAMFTLALVVAPVADAAKRCMGKRATIVRGAGNDVIRGTGASDVIFAGAGHDKIYGGGGNDRICGGPGNDTINGERGSDRLSGDGGNDTIMGLTGKDKLFGGAGDDELRGWRGSDWLDGGPGSDRLFGENGNDRLDGGPGNGDRVDGGPGDEPWVSGGPGSYDVVIGGTGVDRIDGGPGAHDIASYTTSSVGVSVDLRYGRMHGSESERLTGIEDVLGSPANDRLTGSGARNRLDGGPGDDRLQSIGRGDAAFGGPGSDTCTGGFASLSSCGRSAGSGKAVAVELLASIDKASSFVVDGTDGNDQVQVRRSGRTYTAKGSGGTRIVPGSPGSGNCRASSRTVVTCSGNSDRILASLGSGNDTIALIGVPRGVESTLDGGRGSDNLSGGRGRDVIYSGDDRVADRLAGGGGDDVLFGVNTAHPRRDSGAAAMYGGGGNDLLVGGQPCDGDLFDGGPGPNDSASFARIRNSGVFVRATIGGAVSDPDAGSCNAGRITGSVEKIEGSPGPDQLFGDGSANTLLGRGGNDLLDGNGGHDRCVGGGGSDRARQCEQTGGIP